VHLLQFRGLLGRNLRFAPGANLYAEVNCPDVPNYGPFLPLFRLCNTDGQLISTGTFLTNRYAGGRAGSDRRPRGVSLRSLVLQRPQSGADGAATATFTVGRRMRYRPRDHALGILLTDADTGRPVNLDYHTLTHVTAGARGNVAQVRLTVPSGTTLPAHVRAYVMTDVFALASRSL
jgi:hypothetical protein